MKPLQLSPLATRVMKRAHDSEGGVAVMVPQSRATVLCCLCGVNITPNPTMMCVNCLKGEIDITEGIPKQMSLPWCRTCERYLKPPWTQCEPESRELLGICLKRLKGLQRVKLVDAAFLYTEPHSRRLKVKLTIQKEVTNGAVLQQVLIVEYVVQSSQCDDCKKTYTPHTWVAVVQVRQKVDHKRSFFFLEQKILTHDAHNKVHFITEKSDGLDFHFGHRSHAMSFRDFVNSTLTSRSKYARQLTSHDDHSNVFNYKYTINIELCPICRDDLVFMDRKVAKILGGVPKFMLTVKVGSNISLIDPKTLRGFDVSGIEYWRTQFQTACSRRHLTAFMVLSVELLDIDRDSRTAKHSVVGHRAFQLAEVEIAKMSDLGHNDIRHTVRTHLGMYLKEGDTVLGYDLETLNLPIHEELEDNDLTIVLVKKYYERKSNKRKRRWALRQLAKETEGKVDDEKKAEEFEEFQQDLEENPDLRRGVNLYHLPGADDAPPKPEEKDEELDEDEVPDVLLSELLGGLQIEEDLVEVPSGAHAPVPEDDEEAAEP